MPKKCKLIVKSDRISIRAGIRGYGKIIKDVKFSYHKCNSGCQCWQIMAEHKKTMLKSAFEQGYDVFNEDGDLLTPPRNLRNACVVVYPTKIEIRGGKMGTGKVLSTKPITNDMKIEHLSRVFTEYGQNLGYRINGVIKKSTKTT